ncbi:hypothetical protein NL316_27690, partial [Klebsiella pneumoniae]|nr:hypothetical protein [Klebsiella pneumoniae]
TSVVCCGGRLCVPIFASVISESGSFRNAGMKWLKSRFTFRFRLAFERVSEFAPECIGRKDAP